MKIIKEIKVDKKNIEEISRLECVERFEWWHDGTIIVFLDTRFTKGKRTASNGEYLCQFENGLWQRFGSEALSKVFRNPGKEGGRQWLE